MSTLSSQKLQHKHSRKARMFSFTNASTTLVYMSTLSLCGDLRLLPQTTAGLKLTWRVKMEKQPLPLPWPLRGVLQCPDGARLNEAHNICEWCPLKAVEFPGGGCVCQVGYIEILDRGWLRCVPRARPKNNIVIL
jgi:hypothetical protein